MEIKGGKNRQDNRTNAFQCLWNKSAEGAARGAPYPKAVTGRGRRRQRKSERRRKRVSRKMRGNKKGVVFCILALGLSLPGCGLGSVTFSAGSAGRAASP